jgi:RNA polymerase sigma factor (sigma-70 family)
MNQPEPTVFVVDDDPELCKSLKWLLESDGLHVEAYTSAQEFQRDCTPARPGCLILDIRMPQISGMELLAKLEADHIDIPVIILTAHGDVPAAVRAMKLGVVDFLQKPVNDETLLDCVHLAIKLDARQRERKAARAKIAERIELLTPREREVMELVVAGNANKQIALNLGVSEKTVEVHRKRIMQKMQVKCSVDLVRSVLSVRETNTGPRSPGANQSNV